MDKIQDHLRAQAHEGCLLANMSTFDAIGSGDYGQENPDRSGQNVDCHGHYVREDVRSHPCRVYTHARGVHARTP